MNTLIAALISARGTIAGWHCAPMAFVDKTTDGCLNMLLANGVGYSSLQTVDSLTRVLLRVASASWDNHHQWGAATGDVIPLV
jgi:hypothetical protein